MLASDVRICEVRCDTQTYHYRTPMKFAGVAVDRATLLNVHLTVQTRHGQTRATGFGSMPLGNVWAWPTRTLSYTQTLDAMVRLAETLAAVYRNCTLCEHPITITHTLEADLARAATTVAESLRLPEPIPTLAALVVASAFDAALHDAFGKAHGRNSYQLLGPAFLQPDLGHFLGSAFAGQRLDMCLREDPVPSLPLYHLVGALDPLTPTDVSQPVGDGWPESLVDWLRHSGATRLKIKLNGDDLAWDVERVIAVERVVEGERVTDERVAGESAQRGATDQAEWRYSLDFNERCASVEYLLEFLARLGERAPQALRRIEYIEQPTARDLRANPANRMHAAARICPVVIDESLVDLPSLDAAMELGYSGAALKACKGLTQSMLLAAAIRQRGLFVCVQDLTCPGASLIQSAGLAARVRGVSAIEANARQYLPAANADWEPRFPGIFDIRDGLMHTGQLTGPGLSAV